LILIVSANFPSKSLPVDKMAESFVVRYKRMESFENLKMYQFENERMEE